MAVIVLAGVILLPVVMVIRREGWGNYSRSPFLILLGWAGKINSRPLYARLGLLSAGQVHKL